MSSDLATEVCYVKLQGFFLRYSTTEGMPSCGAGMVLTDPTPGSLGCEFSDRLWKTLLFQPT